MVKAIILAKTIGEGEEVDTLASEIGGWKYVKEATLTRGNPVLLPTSNLGKGIYGGEPIPRDLSVFVVAPRLDNVIAIARKMGEMKSVVSPSIKLH